MRELIRNIIRELALPYGYWTKERLENEAKKYNTTGEFQKKNTSAYTTARRKGKDFFDKITSHMTKKHIWTDEELYDEVSKYERLADFINQSKDADSAARRRGKEFYNKLTADLEKDYYRFWSDEDITNELQKYKSRREVQLNDPYLYTLAMNKGEEFFDKSLPRVKKLKWTNKELKDEAKKYLSHFDFQKGNNSAYQVARNRGADFYKSITKHFIDNLSTGETLISRILTHFNINFMKQYKFEDCTNLRTGRYCYKLPFDFFLPNNNTCIEYDGIQHFQAVAHFGGEEGFVKRKILDKIKTEYCKKNNIKLIRIPYTMSPEEVETYLLMELGIDN
jgi:hypothetical protein